MRARLAGAAAALLAGLAAAGCGSVAASQEAGSPGRGAQLFAESCGQCHTLADAGTQSPIGPDLDQSFVHVREQGFDESTIRDIVRGQIAYPTVEPGTGEPGMPANLVTGQDAWDVAAYIASVAGVPTEGNGDGNGDGNGNGEAAPDDPRALFTQHCGACHVLSDAGTSGTIGPDLDQTQPPVDRSIEQITNGGGGMPPFRDELSEEQIRALAEYIAQVAGG